MKFISPADAAAETGWDVVVVGSGFGSLFFLLKYLERRPNDKILIIEKGAHNTHEWQLANRLNSPTLPEETYRQGGKVHKPWDFTIGLGGSTNCWWALTPRLHPTDFDLFTRLGKGADWPIGYDDLVPYWQEAEQFMQIAGSAELDAIYPGTKDYPQKPHQLTTADEIMHRAGDRFHFPMPTAKLSRPIGNRGRCCSSATCNLCPTEAKFTGLNSMQSVLSHPSVSICLESEVQHLDVGNGVVRSVQFRNRQREFRVNCDFCVLGANAIHSPFIMLRSGISGHGVGRYLGEKMLAYAEISLDGLDHFDGGTSTPAVNLSLLQEGRSSDHSTAIILIKNGFEPGLRLDPGRWRQTMPLSLYIEDTFDYENGVFDDGGDTPVVKFNGFSDYAEAGLQHALDRLPEIFSPLPVEDVRFEMVWPTMGHVQGSLRMGRTIEDSVVDSDQLCHSVRNLAVVGTSVFPTCGSANPSLSVAALSLRSADRLLA